MSEKDIRELVWEVAQRMANGGPAWAQEGVVLRQVRDQLAETSARPDLKRQQQILDAWHDLFAEKKLAWGYDLDNPNSPFFHLR